MTLHKIDYEGTTLTTRTDFTFHVRAAEPSDHDALAIFFAHVEKDDLRFRFLSPLSSVGPQLLVSLSNVDHDRTENFLAIDADGKTIIASAMLAADADGNRAEVALAIRADFKRKGISWCLLEHVATVARAKGIKTLQSIEARDHYQAIEMEREMGFTASAYPGDASLMLLQVKLSNT